MFSGFSFGEKQFSLTKFSCFLSVVLTRWLNKSDVKSNKNITMYEGKDVSNIFNGWGKAESSPFFT